jgi:hypothetical protein
VNESLAVQSLEGKLIFRLRNQARNDVLE